jgi:hypothetical protein
LPYWTSTTRPSARNLSRKLLSVEFAWNQRKERIAIAYSPVHTFSACPVYKTFIIPALQRETLKASSAWLLIVEESSLYLALQVRRDGANEIGR